MAQINWKDKCWVTTIFLVRDDLKVLLTWNKNLQTWIPVGGHIDVGETPEEAIIREVAEETGFDFKFLDEPHFENDGKLKIIKPYRIQIEDVPHHNKHMNFVFFGKCLSFKDSKTETDEQERLKWFSKEDLEKEEGMLESVKKTSLEAIKSFENV
jgi:8-oxo-dGTP pyrophosphatase MutT (NUDIX family)